MKAKNKPYIPGLIFCALEIIILIIELFIDTFNFENTIIGLIAILPVVAYCFNHNKKFVLISYLFRIIIKVISIIIFINRIQNDYGYSLEAQQRIILENLFVMIFPVIPYVLLISGLLINKKGYRFFVTFVIIAYYIICVIMCVLAYSHVEDLTTIIVSILSNIIFGLYIISIWYKVALSEYFVLKSEAKVVTFNEKEILCAEFSLEDLKSLFDKGEITENEYNAKKAEIMKKL